MSRRPNIIVTIADDQRFDTIRALNNPVIHTPHLDALARRGTSYLRAHHGGSTHGAVCAPSRAQLHTGRTLFHVSDSLHECERTMRRMRIVERPVPTLGSLLRDAGYDAFGAGKWHNGEESFVRSFSAGKNVFFGGMCPHFCVSAANLVDGELKGRGMRPGHSTEVFSSAAVDFLRTRSRDDKPFFLYCAFTAPHDPRETHHRFRKLYHDHPPAPGNFLPDHPFPLMRGLMRDEALAEFPRNADEVRMHLADYYAMTTHMDEGIGRIHQALDEAGLTDDTIVVHTADHGLAVGQHGLMGKQNLYDHSVRVPLIVAGPSFEKGATDERLCYQHDLFPTLLDHAGVSASSEFEHLQPSTRRESVRSMYEESIRMARDERWKLIEYSVPDDGPDGLVRRAQLFDTAADPLETRDLSADPGHAEDLRRMRRILKDELTKADDPQASVFCA